MTDQSKNLTIPGDLAGCQLLSDAYCHWQAYDSVPPRWRAVDLLDYADFAEQMTILQFEPTCGRYKVLFKGNALARITGNHKGGAYLDETVTGSGLRYLTKDLDEVRGRRVPLLKEKTLGWRDLDHLLYRILLMPFRGATEEVEYILNVLQFELSGNAIGSQENAGTISTL